MTDYLEEHLGSAEALLKRIRQMEQSVSGLPDDPEENLDNLAEYREKEKDFDGKSGIISKNKEKVYSAKNEVNQAEEIVDKSEIDPEIQGEEENNVVNQQEKIDDKRRNPEQVEVTSSVDETEETNVERAENRSPLSAQLEELDRAVSALTTLIPEGRGTAQNGWNAGRRTGSYPISLPGPQGSAVGPTVTGVPGGVWNSPGAAARADFACGGTQSWAEQADRVFRRDSRRYDGGFFLY